MSDSPAVGQPTEVEAAAPAAVVESTGAAAEAKIPVLQAVSAVDVTFDMTRSEILANGGPSPDQESARKATDLSLTADMTRSEIWANGGPGPNEELPATTVASSSPAAAAPPDVTSPEKVANGVASPDEEPPMTATVSAKLVVPPPLGSVASSSDAAAGVSPGNSPNPSPRGRTGRRQTAVLDRARLINKEAKEAEVRKTNPRKSIAASASAADVDGGAVTNTLTQPKLAKGKSRKSVIPNFTALPLLSVEAADILLKAMRDAVDQLDSSRDNVVRLNGAEVDLLILYERFSGLSDAALRSQGTEIIDIFGDKDRIFKARAIAMDVEFSPMHAKDRRIKTMKERCDAVEQYIEDYVEAPVDAPSSFVGQSRKSIRIKETLARKRRELAEGRNSAGRYRNVMWALSWLYAHRHRHAWEKPGDEQEDLPRISVKDEEGNVTVDVEEASSDSDDDDDEGSEGEEYDGNPAPLQRNSIVRIPKKKKSEQTVDTGHFGEGGVSRQTSKKKGLMVSTQEVDIVSASPENLVLLMTEEQRMRFRGQSSNHSVWGQYMDLVCVRSTGDYKHH